MRDEIDWVRLADYYAGRMSLPERMELERRLAADEEDRRVADGMRRVWERAGELRQPVGPVDVREAWAALERRLGGGRDRLPVSGLRVLPGTSAGRPARLARRGWLAAGIAAALAGSAVVTWWQQRAVNERAALPPAREFATTRGQRAELMLDDGTRVWLSVDSRLRVPEGYGGRTRDVTLEGEAYFIVHADPKRPFRVHTRGAVSEDLGTEFAVRAYLDDPDAAMVVVASGRVAVRGADAPAAAGRGVELGRGQMGRLDRAGRLTVTDSVDLAGLLGWREGRLEFEERPLGEVVRELERWYDLEIVLADSSLARALVTTSLDGQTADHALATLTTALELRQSRDGRRVHLAPAAARR